MCMYNYFVIIYSVICVCMNVLTFNIQYFVLYNRCMYEFLTFDIQCFILCDISIVLIF